MDLKPQLEIKRYQADYLLNNENRLNAMEAFMTTIESPCEILVKNSEEAKLGSASAAWKTLTTIGDAVDDASTVLDIPLREKELYEAILIDIFEEAMTNRLLSSAGERAQQAEALYKMLADFPIDAPVDISNMCLFIRDGEAYKGTDMAGFLNDTLEYLHLDQFIKIDANNMNEFMEGWESISTIKEFLTAAKQCLKSVIISIQISQMSEEMQDVLREMYAASKSNANLRQALKELSSAIDSSAAVYLKPHCIAGKFVVKQEIRMFWNTVKTQFGPGVNGLIALYKVEKLAMDAFAGSDKTAEAFVRMDAVDEIEQIIKNIYFSKKSKYKSTKDIYDAGVYLSATDLFFYTLTVDCQYALEFCDAVDSAWLSKLLGLVGANDAAELKKSVKSIQDSVATKRKQNETGWIYQLEVDYPREYEFYKHMLEEDEVSAVYEIHCPVNVEVRRATGELAASVADHKAWWDKESNLVAAVDGDGAKIWFYGREDFYSIRYTGIGEGSMDIAIQRFDSEGTQMQKAEYHNVPLSVGAVYTSEEDLSSATGSYTLTDDANAWNPIDPDVDTSLPGRQKYRLTVKNGYSIYDVTQGPVNSAECYPGETILVYTSGMANRDFLRWKASLVVSSNL